MKIVIIGGGPAGLMSAIACSNEDNEVIIYEKNEKIGKKLYITGKGRCNITNARPMSEFMDQVVSNNKFLYSAFNAFSNKDIIKLLNDFGLKTKVERGDRIFPESDKSSDVIKTFEKICKQKNIKVKLHKNVTYIEKIGQKFNIYSEDGLLTDCDKLILACGGLSYPSTGSTGNGYKFAKQFGHTIIAPKPALTGFLINDRDLFDLSGVTLKNVSLNFKIKNKKFSYFGEMLFTGKGISGPIVLTASSIITKNIDKLNSMSLDLKPALDMETLDNRLTREFEQEPNKQISTILENLTIKAMVPVILSRLNIDKNKKVNQISKKERRDICEIFKAFKIDFNNLLDVKYAIITSGGVNVKELNPSTMESKLVDGLYFAGELIDVDALTGGYNLQIAYSTGYLAGNSAKNGGNNV